MPFNAGSLKTAVKKNDKTVGPVNRCQIHSCMCIYMYIHIKITQTNRHVCMHIHNESAPVFMSGTCDSV